MPHFARRSFLGLGFLCGTGSASVLAGSAHQSPAAMPVDSWQDWDRWSRSEGAPWMSQLIALAKLPGRPSVEYHDLLNRALRITGAVATRADRCVLHHFESIAGVAHGHVETSFRWASDVPVPRLLLPHFRPENRGQDFPRGVPYYRMEDYR